MTKLDILNQTSELNIFYHYLKISEHPKGNISSPFSDDKHPSFKLYKNGSFKCHSTGRQGDVWQFVADIHNLNVKKDFAKILQIIAHDLQLSIIDNTDSKSQHFQVETEDLKPLHFNYYKQFKVSPEILKSHGVHAVKKFQYWNNQKNTIQKFPVYDGVIAVAYEVNNNFEIYIPKQPEKKVSKFFYNGLKSDDIFGLAQLPETCDSIIIAAGKKDCLVLNANGYHAVSFRSENHYPTQAQISNLKSRCSKLFICYDNDFDKTNNPGQEAQKKIANAYNIIPIYLPEKINDVAELYFHNQTLDKYFKEAAEAFNAKDLQDEADEESKRTIFHITEKYLNAHYKFRYNTIKLDIEFKALNPVAERTRNWDSVNENTLYIELQKKGINVSIDKLLAILKSDFTPPYNPIQHYFSELQKWKKTDVDYIEQLASFVKAEHQKEFNYHLKKWLVRSVKCAMIDDYFNKQAFILVHNAQNSGKTSFCRFLCPPKLKDYIAEDISNDKDARVLLCKNFLINLDELAVLSRQEINHLKAFFTKSQINERLPYDRKNSIIPRVCSFIGSTNQDEFLSDETGSVRWLCFKINTIDWSYRSKINIDNVWSQALTLANDSSFESEMTPQDIDSNERRNRDFQIVSVERELINKAFIAPLSSNGEGRGGEVFMTATEVMQHLMKVFPFMPKNINRVAVGRAMKQENYERIKSTSGVYGYYVNPIQQTSGNGHHTPDTFVNKQGLWQASDFPKR